MWNNKNKDRESAEGSVQNPLADMITNSTKRGSEAEPATGDYELRDDETRRRTVSTVAKGPQGPLEDVETEDGDEYTLHTLLEESERSKAKLQSPWYEDMKTLLKKHTPRITLYKFLKENYCKPGAGGVLAADLAAAFVVTIMLVPQGMAYASLANVPPEYGVTTGIVSLLIYPLFGTSPVLAVGPSAILSLLTAETAIDFGVDPEREEQRSIQVAATLGLFSGLVILFMGLARAGHLASFFSRPVLKGFTTGVGWTTAIVIASSQLDKLFGVKGKQSDVAHEIWVDVIKKIDRGNTQLETLYLAIANFALFLGFKYGKIYLAKYLKNHPEKYPNWVETVVTAFPHQLVIIVINIIVVLELELDKKGVSTIGKLPSGWVSLDNMFLDDMADFLAQMFPSIIIVALLGIVESVSGAKTWALKLGHRLQINQELVGLGAMNLIGGFFGSFPSDGSISRTAVQASVGSKTTVSGLFAGTLLTFVLFFLLGLFEKLPNVTLAVMIIVAVFGMMDFNMPLQLWKINRRDFFPWAVTFILTVVAGVKPGVIFGTIFSLVIVLQFASKPPYDVLGKYKTPDGLTEVYRSKKNHPFSVVEEDEVKLLRFESHLFFANSEYFTDVVGQVVIPAIDWNNSLLENRQTKVVGLDMSSVTSVDYTSLQVMHELHNATEERLLAHRKWLGNMLRLENVEDESDALSARRKVVFGEYSSSDEIKVPSFALFNVQLPVISLFMRERLAHDKPIQIEYAPLPKEAIDNEPQLSPYFLVSQYKSSKMVIFFDASLRECLGVHDGMKTVKALLKTDFFD